MKCLATLLGKWADCRRAPQDLGKRVFSLPLFQQLRPGVLRPVQDANDQHVRTERLEENDVLSVGARPQAVAKLGPRPIDQRCQCESAALVAQFDQVAERAAWVVVGDVVTNVFEIGLGQVSLCTRRSITRCNARWG